MDAILWPARNIAEFAYCPRLFYLMEVEGLHQHSADTLQGVRVHNRVDAPSKVDDDPDKPKAVRSLVLTNHELSLTATLDLAEIDGNSAVPVEYRKGRPKRVYEEDGEDESNSEWEPWPTDRVQLALQAILLEREGYEVNRGVLYYASIRRRLDVPITTELRREALEILEQAVSASGGDRPPPLVNDPRCNGCSLFAICLPDEINAAHFESVPTKKMWPPRDDGIHLVAQTKGTRIGVRGSTLVINQADDTPPQEIPLANLESLSLLGAVQLSTQALHTLADRNVPVAFLSGAGRLITMIDPMDSVSAWTRRNQVHQFDSELSSLEFARAIVAAKIRNQRTLLQRNNPTVPRPILDSLSAQVTQAEAATSLESLRGHEGQAAALYFEHFAGMFSSDIAKEFDQNGRQRRPPPDPINSCLSMAYTMLTHECVSALRVARLEPSIGAYHVSRPGRPALALDLLEPFRPLIADSMTISAFNRGELREGHFTRTASGCMFTDAGRKAFFSVLGRRMSEEVTHPTFGYKLSYRRMLILHARMLAAWINKEIPTLSFLTTR